MKKRQYLTKILSVFSLALVLGGCTQLAYVDSDYETVNTAQIQTSELFSLQTVEKKTTDGIIVRAGISGTVLDNALVLYMEIENKTDSSYKFDVNEVMASSPIGEISFISPSLYVDAYQNFEATNYAGMANASTALNSFANIQNQYRQSSLNNQNFVETKATSPELMQVEKTIQGINKHAITSYKFVEGNSKEYFYIFLRKPEEYPVVIKYKDLTYKFGGKRNND